MKISFLVSIFILLFTVTIVEAETNAQTELIKNDFSVNVSDITYYKDIKKTQFLVKIEEINNPQDIAYWKVRSSCDSKMTIQLTLSSADDCGKVVKLNSLANNAFSFLFKNKTPKSKDFSLKIKAYDNKGKGLHVEDIGFAWK